MNGFKTVTVNRPGVLFVGFVSAYIFASRLPHMRCGNPVAAVMVMAIEKERAPGLPMVLISARLTAERIAREWHRDRTGLKQAGQAFPIGASMNG